MVKYDSFMGLILSTMKLHVVIIVNASNLTNLVSINLLYTNAQLNFNNFRYSDTIHSFKI